jgi:hypothetical protein
MRQRPEAKLRTKVPPSPIVARRRTLLMEAGIDHEAAANVIERWDGIPTKRQSVTAVVNGHLSSSGLRIERRLVTMLRDRFAELGKDGQAERMSMEYLGWDELGNVDEGRGARDSAVA